MRIIDITSIQHIQYAPCLTEHNDDGFILLRPSAEYLQNISISIVVQIRGKRNTDGHFRWRRVAAVDIVGAPMLPKQNETIWPSQVL